MLIAILSEKPDPNLYGKNYFKKTHFSSRLSEIDLLITAPRTVMFNSAGVAKLVDAPDLGSGAARRGGSSPSTRTT